MGLVPAGLIKGYVNKYLIDSSITKALTYKVITNSYTDGENTETPTSYSIRGLEIPYTKEEIDKSAGSIQETDTRFLIRAKYFEDNSITPKTGDKITLGSVTLEVLDFELIEIGTTKQTYEFVCRR